MDLTEQWLIPALQPYTPAAKAAAGGSSAPARLGSAA